MPRKSLALTFLILISIQLYSQTENLKIALILTSTGPFWQDVINYTEATAEDLGIDLVVINRKFEQGEYIIEFEKLCQSNIDGIIFSPNKGNGELSLALLDKYNVPGFTINNPKSLFNFLPRTKYKQWIGEMNPDNVSNGTTLIQQLLDNSDIPKEKDLHILGIEAKGTIAKERSKGFLEYLNNNPRVKSLKMIEGNWQRNNAKKIFLEEYDKNSNINVVWGVTDNISLGILDAIKERNIKKKIYIGGYNWDKDVIKAINKNEISVSVGGHFLMGSFSLIMLHDYILGKDFASEGISFTNPMYTINRSNIQSYSQFLEMEPRYINFINYSQIYTPNILRVFTDISKLVSDVQNRNSRGLELSPIEKEWLRVNKKILVHNDLDWAPINYNKSGTPMGYSIDFMNLIGEKVGLEIEYISGPVWSEFIQMIQSGDLDVMLNIAYSKERDSFLNFTDPYLEFYPSIYIKKGNKNIKDIKDLYGKTFAIQKGYYFEDILKEHSEINLLRVKDTQEAILAVSNGDAEALIDIMPVVNYLTDTMLITNLVPGGTLGGQYNDLIEVSVGIREDSPILNSIIQKGIKAISQDEYLELRQRWLGGTKRERSIELTPGEITFLRANPTIRVHNELNWPPFNFNENNTPKGFSIDFMNLLAKKSGFNIEYISGPTWNEFLEMTKTGDLDVMLNIVKTPDRLEYLNFTKSYIKNPSVIVSKESNKYKKLSELRGKKVAVIEGFFYEEIFRNEYPEFQLVLVDNLLDALKAVSFGEADATVSKESIVNYLIKENFLSGLQISNQIDLGQSETEKMNIAVRKDWPQMVSILNKAIESVSQEEFSELSSKWIVNGSEGKEDTFRIDQIIKLALLILGIILFIFILLGIIRRRRFNEKNFNVKTLRVLSLAILLISIVIISILSIYIVNTIKKDNLKRTRENMYVVLNTTNQNLKNMISSKINQISANSTNPNLLTIVKNLLKEDLNSLVDSKYQKEIREYFQTEQNYTYSQGFFIITPEGVSIASRRDNNIGSLNLIFKERPDLFEKVLQGDPQFIPPIESDAYKDIKDPTSKSSMFYAVPIFDENEKVIAIMTQREDPKVDFSRYCETGRIGTTGETYAFDDRGIMLTESRFKESLENIGFLNQETGIKLVNPGIKLNRDNIPDNLYEMPFTKSINSALLGNTETDINGYLDYRGVKVFGSWLWNNSLEFGLVIEVDEADALSSYNITRSLIFILLIIIIILITSSTIFTISVGEKTNTYLTEANSTLEERVSRRTKDLEEATTNLENTIEALTHPFYVIDANTYEIVLANSAAKKVSKGEEISTCYKLTHRVDSPCNSKEHPCPLQKVKETKKPYTVEHIHYDENDEPRYMEVHGYPIFNENNEIIKMIEYSIDITERKQAEEEIRKSDQRFKIATESARIATWEWFVKDDVTVGSPMYQELFGFDPTQEKVTEVWGERLHPEDREFAFKALEDHLQGKTELYSAEFRYRHPRDEEYIWLSGIAKIVERNEDGSPKVLMGINQDITERKKAEESIQLLTNLVFGSLKSANVGAWWVDFREEDIFHGLDTTAKMIGLPITDEKRYSISGWAKILNDTAQINDKYKEMIDETFNNFYGTIDGTIESYKAIYPILHPGSSKPRWIDARAEVPERFPDGSAKLMTGTLIDVTDQHEAEIELARAKELAEGATKAKSDFLANMSHEIRTPMNAIIGLTSLVQKTELNTKQRDYLNKIYSSSHNLLGIINDILDFSKIEAGKLAMESINFDLHDVFDNLGSMITKKAHDKGIELIFKIGTEVPWKLVGDPLRLGQVLLNLANNAIKFTETGEIAVSTELIKKRDKRAIIKFSVRDTGIGLTKEQCGKLFNAFAQADTSTTRKYGGTGLGLSISKRLVEMMGGNIGVESNYGNGSTFYFTGSFEIREYEKLEIIPKELKGLSVLIVDDNATSREVLSEYVKDFSLKPVVVDNGQEAIQLIRKRHEEGGELFDIALMDYSMPGLTGFQTADKINEILDKNLRPKYILVTGFGRDEVLSGVDRHNFSGFVLKPVNQSLLFNTIMQAFGQEIEVKESHKKGNKPVGFDDIRGAKVLLTEDNEINQQVAKELLEAEGFYVDIANNGLESTKMVEDETYDIILMDLQMPVMGGYDATKVLRDNGLELPIIAMTADAMAGVKEMVIEVGMNDYITKPIDTKKLFQCLVKWIKPGKRDTPANYKPLKEKPEVKIALIDGINVEKGLERVGDNSDLYKKLLKQFSLDYTGFKENLKREINTDNKEAIRSIHSLKGVSANLGIEEVAINAKEIEALLKENKSIENELDRLDDNLKSVIDSINRSDLSSSNENQTDNFTIEEVKNLLKDASVSLKKRKPKPAIEIMDKIKNAIIIEQIKDEIDQIINLITKYKMKDAAKLIDEIEDKL